MASILVVEDDALIGRMLSIRLHMRAHRIDLATDGRQGLELALAGSYDLILMDMHMPLMDGHEVVRRLRERGYTGTIAAVTASAMSEDSQAAIAAGCDDFIAKPIGDDFEDRVEALLGGE